MQAVGLRSSLVRASTRKRPTTKHHLRGTDLNTTDDQPYYDEVTLDPNATEGDEVFKVFKSTNKYEPSSQHSTKGKRKKKKKKRKGKKSEPTATTATTKEAGYPSTKYIRPFVRPAYATKKINFVPPAYAQKSTTATTIIPTNDRR